MSIWDSLNNQVYKSLNEKPVIMKYTLSEAAAILRMYHLAGIYDISFVQYEDGSFHKFNYEFEGRKLFMDFNNLTIVKI